MERWYHGSHTENLALKMDGESDNGAVDFHALFFTNSYSGAEYYGTCVYCVDMDDYRIFNVPHDCGRAACEEALMAVMQARGLRDDEDGTLFGLLWRGAVLENLYFGDEEELSEMTGLDADDGTLGWTLQAIRLELAGRLGFHGASFDDECGSIAILTEYLPERLERVDHDPDGDEEED